MNDEKKFAGAWLETFSVSGRGTMIPKQHSIWGILFVIAGRFSLLCLQQTLPLFGGSYSQYFPDALNVFMLVKLMSKHQYVRRCFYRSLVGYIWKSQLFLGNVQIASVGCLERQPCAPSLFFWRSGFAAFKDTSHITG
jgi:hypothetical protein